MKKPILSKIQPAENSAILVKHDIAPYIDYPLHFHPEYELVLIEKGYGKRIIGDHVDDFTNGDLVFLSPNLPHLWQCDQAFYASNSQLETSCWVLHFKEDSLGHNFFELPDIKELHKLFKKGEQGLLIKGKLKKNITKDLFNLHKIKGINRLILFFDMLKRMAESEETEMLSSIFYQNPMKKSDNERFTRIYEFVLHNFKENIKIEDIAQRLNMTTTSLCRYFKKQSGKTLIEFINEIRIKYACRLLNRTSKSISEICYESGFNNLSNFNRQFRKIVQCNPASYRERNDTMI